MKFSKRIKQRIRSIFSTPINLGISKRGFENKKKLKNENSWGLITEIYEYGGLLDLFTYDIVASPPTKNAYIIYGNII